MHYFGINHDTDIANNSCTQRNHDGGRTKVARSFQHSHKGKEKPHKQKRHRWSVRFNQSGDKVIEVIDRHIFQAVTSPLHIVVNL